MSESTGKTVLVTGATDGIGRATALALADEGANVIVHGRTASKVAKVVEEIKVMTGRKAGASVFDLASLAEIRRGAAELSAQFPRIDVLVNNAGVFMTTRKLSVDGQELTFQVNHLAPFLLTHLLRPVLEASAPARVVNVSSMAHMRGQIHFDDPSLARGFSGYGAYAQSKLANVLFTRGLAKRVDASKITTNALHPGVIATKLLRDGFGMSGGGALEEGCATSVFLALDPSVASVTGRYFDDSRETRAATQATDDGAADRLWELSARIVGIA